MRPLTDRIPKPLIPVAGMTLIERLIAELQAAGVQSFTIGVGWKGKLIESHLLGLSDSDKIQIVTAHDYERGPLTTLINTVGDTAPDRFLLCPADLVADASIASQLISAHHKRGEHQFMTIGVDMTAQRGALVCLGTNGSIVGFNQDGLSNHETVRSAMMSIIERPLLDRLKEAWEDGHASVSSAVNKMISEGFEVAHVPVSGYWSDIDNILDVLETNQRLLQSVEVSPEVGLFVQAGRTFYADDIREPALQDLVGHGTRVVGPVLISPDSVVGPRCIVGPNASLSEGTKVEDDCQIENAVLFGRALVPKKARVQSAILYDRLQLSE
ncbi:MAG: NDP-sugar synthase [Candidatus Thorarchaeota archaeon]|nr:MAG: NDP-sugar synthase [Candidatus Thorarchaeota archaeon]